MNAVMYGAGNIGRGFIGAMFSLAGYRVTFIDVAQPLIDAINRENAYPLRLVSNHGYEERMIRNVDAINGADTAVAAQRIGQADIMAVSVGVRALPFVIPNLVEGIRARFQAGERPLDILICENLMDAQHVIAEMIRRELTAQEQDRFEKQIGLVETSIGRMVPLQTAEMQAGNPLRICAEAYDFLPVDRGAFKGELPAIHTMVPVEPFDFYVKRKLFIHNMGHAVCAYFGLLWRREYIYQAIADPGIRLLVQNAMLESAEAISLQYGQPISPLLRHVMDLLMRFENQALRDTVQRVGQDPKRKLSHGDRFIAAAKECTSAGICPGFIAAGAGAGLHFLLQDTQSDNETARRTLCEVSGLSGDDPLTALIFGAYELCAAQKSADALFQYACQAKASWYGKIL